MQFTATVANIHQSQEEWKAKVRWIIGVLFYCCRFFNATSQRIILQALQPTDPQALDATSNAIFCWFKETILELQDIIWFAHESLAKTFLLATAVGQQYVESYSKTRCALPY